MKNYSKALKIFKAEKSFDPFTVEEMNDRISKSEDDFKNKKFKTTSELLSKYSS
ncbi:hypothetical protein [Chryseobacterium sp. GP-SGM7]|uniref:hypothetical protein n=1 Tax=Chryseobacterium sp. GP-SGM7 TaxID=3411323 RepID=UPI003B955A55